MDYVTRTNEDGSVSIIVGATDWSSRTKWRVKMTVPKEGAYLKIENLWFNPTPLNALRYHWLNAAEHARKDLQFIYPGTHYIGHGGEAHAWPVDEDGRNLSYYKNNDYGQNHSYHVLGTYADFYGGYWHDLDFGFGHWSRYADAPGKKVWIWSPARSGAIWEDLLTDENGQYVEAQAGRKFNQTRSPTGTPFVQKSFPPYVTDTWTETWFPVKDIGGLSDASRSGVLHVSRRADTLTIGVQALQQISDSLTVTVHDTSVYGEPLSLSPMEIARRTVALPADSGPVVVTVGGPELQYTEDEEANALERPLRTSFEPDSTSAEWLFREGGRQYRAQAYEQALNTYRQVLERAPTHLRTLVRVAELYYRRARYEKSIALASKALEIDTYDPGANFVYGIAQRQTGDLVNAKEALGWAARSPAYRSGAYTQMAEVSLQEGDVEGAETYARRALDYNAYNVSAYEALAISYRVRGLQEKAQRTLAQLLEMDPLSHFARFEQYLLDPTQEHLEAFTSMIRSELPDETYLEVAVRYADRGRTEEALRVLSEAPDDPIVQYWRAYLNRNRSKEKAQQYLARALDQSPRLVFPFRLETLPVLKWAAMQNDSWKTKYYLGVLYWSKDRKQRAARLFQQCAEAPDFAPFYLARAALYRDVSLHKDLAANTTQDEEEAVADDLAKAVQIDGNEWRAWRARIAYYSERGDAETALRLSRKAYEKFPGNYHLGLQHAAVLLKNKAYAESAHVLEEAQVLPYEGARRGHDLFVQAHLLLALEAMKSDDYGEALKQLERSKTWPEHLGVGKPFGPDLRLQEYLEAYAYEQRGREREATARLEAVTGYTAAHREAWGLGSYLGAVALRKLGKRAKAKELLEAWESAAGQNDALVQWALAAFNGDRHSMQERARALGRQHLDNSGYRLLRAFMDLKN